MDKRTQGILFTVAAVLFCGCPGLFICLFGAITATGNGTFNDAYLEPSIGFVLMCLSLIFVAIPIAVGFFTLRKKPEVPASNEPLPPAS